MKTKNLITLFLALFVTFGMMSQETEKEKEIQQKAEMLKEKMMKKDPTISTFFNDAEGYVIFPSVGKGGLIIGGAYGKGAVYQNGTYIGSASLKQLDVGLQAGGKTYGEIIFFETEEALQNFKDDKFELSAEVSAIAIDEGVAKKAKFKDDIAVFIMPKKGLMVDASIGGQRFTFEEPEYEDDDNEDKKDTRVSDF